VIPQQEERKERCDSVDVNVAQAVDKPALSHLRNVIVFPQVGPRPHPNELSGSDLDGDIYFVTWNPDLLPPLNRRNPEPGSYPTVVPKEKAPGELVTSEDLVDFFVDFAKNDNLGIIANMHLAIAGELLR
jgi:RNA-dependent RNA polymerase